MVAVVGREAMHMMRRIKSIASGRSSVSDPVRVLFFFFFLLCGMSVVEICKDWCIFLGNLIMVFVL